MQYRTLLLAAMLAALSSAAGAGPVWDSVKDGASTVKEGASKAAEKAVDTVTSTKESLGDEDTPEATRAKLDAMAESTLARLFEEEPSARELFDQSFGYAVFDTRQLMMKLAAGYGRGVAVQKETSGRIYMKMATGGVGLSFGFGGFASQLVILFQEQGNYLEFVEKGYDTKAEASALHGEERTELAARFTDGTAVFLLTESGWKVAASMTGTKYWRDEELNVGSLE